MIKKLKTILKNYLFQNELDELDSLRMKVKDYKKLCRLLKAPTLLVDKPSYIYFENLPSDVHKWLVDKNILCKFCNDMLDEYDIHCSSCGKFTWEKKE